MQPRAFSTRVAAFLICLALLLSSVTVAAGQDAGAAPSSAPMPQAEIAYVLDGDIWLYDTVTGDSTQLTTDGDNRWPAWSPDGQTLLYTHARGEDAFDLYAVDMVQEEPRLLAEDACCGGFHPDGDRIAYIDLSGVDLRVAAMALNGSAVDTMIDSLQYGRASWPSGGLTWILLPYGEWLRIPLHVIEGSAGKGLREYEAVFDVELGAHGAALLPLDESGPPIASFDYSLGEDGDWEILADAFVLAEPHYFEPDVFIQGRNVVVTGNEPHKILKNLSYPSLSPDGAWLVAERYPDEADLNDQEPEGIVMHEADGDTEMLIVEGGSQPAWRPAAPLPRAAQQGALAGERIVEISPALSWQGDTYQVYYYTAGDYRRPDARFFSIATPTFLERQGIAGLLVTRDGSRVVTDTALLRDLFVLYRAAHTLYSAPPATVDLGWEQELGKVLDNPLFMAMEPVQALRSRRAQYADAFRLLLTDSRDASELDALLDEALATTPETVEEALGAVTAILDDRRDVAEELGILSDDLKAVFAGAESDLFGGANALKAVRFAARLLWVDQLQQERAQWLAAYADSLLDGPGALDRDQVRALADVLAEVGDAHAQRVNIARRILWEEGLDAALKLSGDAAAAALNALAQKAAQEAGVRLSAHTASSALAAAGIGLTVNDILYGVGDLWSEFTLAQRSDELRALFYAGRQQIEQQAGSDAESWDGNLAGQWRAAYLLETLAAANAQRSYAAGVAATYRLPNPLELLNWLRGQDWRTAVVGLKDNAATLEQQAIEDYGAPPALDALLNLAVQRAATLPATQDVAGDTWTEPASGITFVRVPVGEFNMGSTDAQVDAALEMCNASSGNCERIWFERETPQHQVTLDEYRIGLTEVTNAQFRPFVEGGGYADASLWTEAGWAWRTDYGVTQPRYWNDVEWNRPDRPVVGVSWYEAVAYTRWLTRAAGREFRLPTEAEWEKACRGTDGRTWPWGDEPPDAERANFNDDVGSTTAVGSYPAGASPSGALDMAGNVWEWTSSLYKGYPYDAGDGREDPEAEGARMLRGGAFLNFGVDVRCAFRNFSDPDFRLNYIGFRVVSPGF